MQTPKYQPAQFESKWVAKWNADKTYATPHIASDDAKAYVLDMYPYPSGSGLHVGHVEGYTATDIYCRYMRMRGIAILHPIGFDSFGLPAENYAVKTGTHPKITTEDAIATFTSQMQAIGLSYDWDLVLAAHRPDYYKWTQWLFLLMYRRGLAYRKKQAVNWCDGCQTVLANEQVVDGHCERCETAVVQKEMEQWFLKITDYTERLLNDLEKLDWPESTKAGQRNWIGRSEGINIEYRVQGTEHKVEVFTTRPDTNFGATFIVCAPDSDFVKKHMSHFPEYEKVKAYCIESLKKRELERVGTEREKTGVFTGWYALNELNNAQLPIYVADFALGNVGTGCLVGVPGHDQRDFEFAQAMKLPIIRVVVGPDGDTSEILTVTQVQEEQGTMINSGFLDGMDIHEATKQMMDYMEEKEYGKRVTRFKLRDWLISRQRFWGAPIPMRKSPVVSRQSSDPEYKYEPVGESELPVVLPMDVEFKPTGKSPLTEHPDFQDREVDTMDTFVDSSWYFFRFVQLLSEEARKKASAGTETNPFDDETLKILLNKWCPVDLYVGGAEHTVLHLLYARFFTKVLFDAGYINFDEPFLKLRHQGIILGPDHRKMSKRWGNVINPLDVIAQYGADTLRMYEMFMGPLDQMKAWNVASVAGIYRFLSRVWNIANTAIHNTTHNISSSDEEEYPQGEVVGPKSTTPNPSLSKEGNHDSLKRALHKMIKKVTEDIPELKFNTAIAECMIFMNAWEKAGAEALSNEDFEKFLLVLAPFAPFMTEELWSLAGHADSIHHASWPSYEASLLVSETVEIPVQVNGRVRGTLTVAIDSIAQENLILAQATALESVKRFVTGDIVKTVYVPGKILNIVCR